MLFLNLNHRNFKNKVLILGLKIGHLNPVTFNGSILILGVFFSQILHQWIFLPELASGWDFFESRSRGFGIGIFLFWAISKNPKNSEKILSEFWIFHNFGIFIPGIFVGRDISRQKGASDFYHNLDKSSKFLKFSKIRATLTGSREPKISKQKMKTWRII